ncbi:class I SAM-dependent methyltransferase [Epilithonimonas mollis]|uniref:Methyltransferase domain-containing protein n=1 Tax=Epilithonimonas mollis TaxID=216903 RepID=A0A1M6RXY4_9FLAO|nr:class I SAM-dependent methyltransferase [Epilithonimonas mollis]SHK37177.1 Methyltransferase domain-containing protein [Epilithonimonas mollis]
MEPKHKDSSEVWSHVADLYEEKFLNLSIYDDSYDWFCNEIKMPEPAVLDIGCGPGNISKYISGKIHDADISGIDYSENMILLAKKNVPNGQFEVMDCREVAKLNRKFDAIIGGFCIPYLNERELNVFLSDINNLLKGNGILYLSFVEGKPEESKYQTSSTGHQLFFNFHRIESIKQNLKNIGFQHFQTMYINYKKSPNETEVHTVIITKK